VFAYDEAGLRGFRSHPSRPSPPQSQPHSLSLFVHSRGVFPRSLPPPGPGHKNSGPFVAAPRSKRKRMWTRRTVGGNPFASPLWNSCIRWYVTLT
jgi:hypothetical protein